MSRPLERRTERLVVYGERLLRLARRISLSGRGSTEALERAAEYSDRAANVFRYAAALHAEQEQDDASQLA